MCSDEMTKVSTASFGSIVTHGVGILMVSLDPYIVRSLNISEIGVEGYVSREV